MNRSLLTISASILALGVSTASAQQSGHSMQDYDTDANSSVSQEEFATGSSSNASASFSASDADQSSGLSQEEFFTGAFDRADQNSDDSLDEQEFQSAGASSMNLSDVDADGDGQVSRDEWNQGMSSDMASGPGTFSDYDADQSGDISSEEYGQGEFRRFDANQDESLDETEFGSYSQEAQNQQSN